MLNDATVSSIRDELAETITGKRVGRVFQLSRLEFAFDIRDGGPFLFVSADPASPRAYLIRRKLRDLERSSVQPQAFAQGLRKRIAGARVNSVEKIPDERILVLGLAGETELGTPTSHSLVIQLTGRSANLFLLDEDGRIVDRVRDTFGEGQEIASAYRAPESRAARRVAGAPYRIDGFDSISDALDAHYLAAADQKEWKRICSTANARIAAEAAKIEKLADKLRQDLARHGDPVDWKRLGDLLLANLADAARIDGKVLVVDYFDAAAPVVEIEVDESDSLTEAAEKFFRRYTKARNAREELNERLSDLSRLRVEAEERRAMLDDAIAKRDADAVRNLAGIAEPRATRSKRKEAPEAPRGTRRFVSSDGFEILVGKGARENDLLTFRIGRANDLWLHAADYPGSHVIVRNPARAEIPQRTVFEAARHAAMYSDAREQPKIAVHYTLRKNVHKPRGAAPGLVRLAAFKTIIVTGEGKG